MSNSAKQRLMELLAAKKTAETAARIAAIPHKSPDASVVLDVQEKFTGLNGIVYNDRQNEFIRLGVSGLSCALTGAAGCGKTTALTGLLAQLIQSGRVGKLNADNHKHLTNGSPSIAFISFTNKAVANIKKVLPADVRSNAMTAHKLLEFEPEYYQETNEKGELVNRMRFAPMRTANHPLPFLDVLVIDEAPMMPVSLWNLIADALPVGRPLQLILVGDIQQLPPVFGKSVYIHAIQQGMPYVELTEVYRQALNSPIIRLATEVVKGKQIGLPRFPEFEGDTPHGKVSIKPWKKKLSDLAALKLMSLWLPEQIEAGSYDPLSHMIITPYNEAFGTIEINKIVANHIAKKLQEPVYEIFAGVKKLYLRVGERVLFNKSDARIVKIERNPNYFGKLPRAPSVTMTYGGVETNPAQAALSGVSAESAEEIDFMLEAMGSHLKDDERGSNQASHKITILVPELELEQTIQTTGELGKLDLGYAITVYKSQGSEYDTVFLLTHGSQGGQIFRESVYTAITRAKRQLFIVCEPNFFVKGINSQRLPGASLADKLKEFEKLYAQGKTAESEKPLKTFLFTADINRRSDYEISASR